MSLESGLTNFSLSFYNAELLLDYFRF